MNNSTIELATHHAIRMVHLLTARQYEKIVEETRGKRLSAQDIKKSVDTFNLTLYFPPDYGGQNIDLVEVSRKDCKGYAMICSLFSEEEGGISDLSFELSVFIKKNGDVEIETESIHVL